MNLKIREIETSLQICWGKFANLKKINKFKLQKLAVHYKLEINTHEKTVQAKKMKFNQAKPCPFIIEKDNALSVTYRHRAYPNVPELLWRVTC
jgi:hypothetical protein